MDILYSRVFSSCSPAARERCHSILSAIVIFETPTIATLSDLLQIHTSHLLLDLHHLANIIKVEELPTLPTTVTHSEFPVAAYLSPIVSFSDDSWREFCKNKSRAGDFWVDSEATHKSLLERADLLLARSISPSPIHIHHSTWKMIFYYLTDAWSDNKAKDDFVGYWKASWPLFAEEFKTFQSSDPTQQGVLTGNQQCVRAFRLLLRCFTEVNEKIFQPKSGHLTYLILSAYLGHGSPIPI
ncbi:hypothetical protein CPB83DRAFT_542186 [Crepidotus variabilis]|uniref:Uncharacterized protein n=1 Tax=Crepidotus variabilis TaxID=179855 RepID=A0A9P6ENZ9_9AGAR|nr:hypothetical protein CPB83DRAFT_542186 [Crepidotus variabilis]